MRTSDAELGQRLVDDPREGWRLFIATHTPTLVAIIERAGLRRHDEAMDIYVRVCEHLAANDCERLRRHDPSKGTLASWLTVVVRHAIVDWVRSRKGRRRVFQSIRRLAPLDREVFELYYWRGHSPTEIAGLLSAREEGRRLVDVFESLDRIERALSERQRAELMSMAARAQSPVSLEDTEARLMIEPMDRRNPESDLRAAEAQQALSAALAELPAEDGLIVSMRYLDGLSQKQVERALHIPPVRLERLQGILARLRGLLERRGMDARDLALGIDSGGRMPAE